MPPVKAVSDGPGHGSARVHPTASGQESCVSFGLAAAKLSAATLMARDSNRAA
jgi:hypothetical protein